MYITVAEANEYFNTNRLYKYAWLEATTANKTLALQEATDRIDRLRFSGWMVADDQGLEFPRYYDFEEGPDGTEEIPASVEYATAEIALALLDGVDPELEFENMNVSSTAYSSVRMSRNMQDIPAHTAAGIPSALAWRYLLPYLSPARPIKLNRV